MKSFHRTSLLLAALAVAAPAMATPISGGFDISGYVNDVTISSSSGMVFFGSGQETVANPSNGWGTFASIAPGTALDFSSILSLYLVYNGNNPTLFSFTFNGDLYRFDVTSVTNGPTVKIAGTMTDVTNPNSGYGEIDFTSPDGGVGNFTGTYQSSEEPPVLPGVPEPSSLVLLGTGLAGFAGRFLRRRATA